jgi:hypothetical protein
LLEEGVAFGIYTISTLEFSSNHQIEILDMYWQLKLRLHSTSQANQAPIRLTITTDH